MKKFFKWIGYFFLVFTTSVAVVFFIAYLKREDIKNEIVERFNERINGDVTVDKIHFTVFHHFPDFSITLLDVTLLDTLDSRPVLKAKKIYLDIGLYSLFRNQIDMSALSIDNGSLFLYKGSDGYSNTNVFTAKKDSARSAGGQRFALNINSITLKHVAVSYADSAKQKRIAFNILESRHTLDRQVDFDDMKMTGKIFCEELTFNNEAGGFLKNQPFEISTQLRYHKKLQKLSISPTLVTVNDNKIQLDGEFSFDEEALFSLHIEARDLLFKQGLAYLTPRIQQALEKFSVDKPVDIDVKLNGKHRGGGEPMADVRFSGKQVNFAFEKLEIQQVTSTGHYFHRPDPSKKGKDDSRVEIESFSGLLEGIACEGTVSFTTLADPVMDLSMKSTMNHLTFNTLVDTTEWVARRGTFYSSVKYKGKLEEYLDSRRSKYKGKLSGSFRSRNGSFIFKPKDLVMEQVNAFFNFTESQFNIDSLSMALNGNPVSMKGSMKNYIPFFIQPENRGYVRLNVTSPRLDLTFIATRKSESKSKKEQVVARKRVNGVIDIVRRKLEFDIKLSADDFQYKKFNAQKIKGQVKLDQHILEASDVQMKVAGGDMLARLTFRHDNTRQRSLSASTQIKRADIREFFTLFSDFGQSTIHAKNLAGKISATASISADVLEDYRVDPESMRGYVSCNIEDGRLIDFEPLENLSNFLFRKRDFSDVQFAELESYFDINGTDIDIDRMEVQSTVLSFFLQGRYSFTDSTSMSLQLPLNNLKKRDKNYKPENVGTRSKTGMSVYLHVFRDKDITSKINITYDPFKKWVKAGNSARQAK